MKLQWYSKEKINTWNDYLFKVFVTQGQNLAYIQIPNQYERNLSTALNYFRYTYSIITCNKLSSNEDWSDFVRIQKLFHLNRNLFEPIPTFWILMRPDTPYPAQISHQTSPISQLLPTSPGKAGKAALQSISSAVRVFCAFGYIFRSLFEWIFKSFTL